MNRLLTLFVFLLFANLIWSQRNLHIAGYTRIEVGYPYTGSHQKESASFALEQSFTSPMNDHFSVGLGTGFALYPEAFTIPVFAVGTYRIPIKNRYISWNHRIGVNLKAGQNAFFGYRYNTTFDYSIRLNRKILAFVGIGANYLWDPWGSQSLRGAFQAGIVYTVFNGRQAQLKKGPPPPREKDNW